MRKIEEYKGWDIYYSGTPSPLWKASKGMEEDLFSYFSLEKLKEYIDAAEDKKRGLRVR